jgi:hypothetical protein
MIKRNEVMWFCLEMSWIMHVKVNIINRKVYKRNIVFSIKVKNVIYGENIKRD